MDKGLVEVKKNEVYCDSIIVAKKFNQQHKEVVKRIEKLESDFAKLRGVSNPSKILLEEREYRGQKYIAYLMNREFFSLLVMRFKGTKALEWQIKFNEAFYEMERQLLLYKNNTNDPEFLQTRNQVRIGRKEEADVIKQFVDYATEQGSTKAQYYYKHLTNSTYKALGLMFQKMPKLRDTMSIYELSELLLMERYAKDRLSYYMSIKRHYKDIYESVKDDMFEYGKAITIPRLAKLGE